MPSLPFLDEHRLRVHGSPDAVWAALLEVVRRMMSSQGSRFARLLACDPADATPPFTGAPGDAIPGFRVVDAEPARRLVLRGRHRFAQYEFAFHLEGEELSAVSRADFPGAFGQVYRAMVLGSGAHRVITRGLLRRVAAAI